MYACDLMFGQQCRLSLINVKCATADKLWYKLQVQQWKSIKILGKEKFKCTLGTKEVSVGLSQSNVKQRKS